MLDTQTQQARRATRMRLVLAGLVAVLLIAAGILTVRVEPARSAVWSVFGTSCGEMQLPYQGVSGTNDNRPAETCFVQAYARCHAASLTADQRTGLDTSFSHTFVVEPGILSPCGLADRWENLVDAGAIRQGGMVICAGLTPQADGLLVRGCGSLGDILLPAES